MKLDLHALIGEGFILLLMPWIQVFMGWASWNHYKKVFYISDQSTHYGNLLESFDDRKQTPCLWESKD